MSLGDWGFLGTQLKIAREFICLKLDILRGAVFTALRSTLENEIMLMIRNELRG